MFGKPLKQFFKVNQTVLSSKLLLPDDSFSYIRETWLDHCVCTADAHASLSHIDIVYSYATYDHVPLSNSLNVDNIPAVVEE